MPAEQILLLAAGFFIAAGLYSSVGHGGASAYLGIMALVSVSPEVMRPTALALNLLVSSIATIRFFRAGQFSLRLFLTFSVLAVPLAFLGGWISLPSEFYLRLVGIVLLLAAARLAWRPAVPLDAPTHPPSSAVAVSVGGAIGLLAGLTGTGGGIFLSPLILLNRWETPRRTSGIAAMFILVNSAAGLAGNWTATRALPAQLPYFLVAVGAGAAIGTWLGVRWIPRRRLEQVLAIVLLVAGIKLVLS